MKLMKLEIDDGPIVKGICEDMAETGQPFADIFSDFLEKYDQIIDDILLTRHGKKEVFTDMLEEIGSNPLYYYTIQAYLTERAPWIRQQMAYIEAEYDPIENYAGHESESIVEDSSLRNSATTYTINPYTLKRKRLNPEIITEQYAENEIKTETSQLKSTTQNSVTSFDDDTPHNDTKTETTPGTITNTEKPYNRKVKTPQHEVVDSEILEGNRISSEVTYDQPHQEIRTRTFDRHGNLGVQTASQMMQLDSSWWKDNRWLSTLALDIVNLICERVEAI